MRTPPRFFASTAWFAICRNSRRRFNASRAHQWRPGSAAASGSNNREIGISLDNSRQPIFSPAPTKHATLGHPLFVPKTWTSLMGVHILHILTVFPSAIREIKIWGLIEAAHRLHVFSIAKTAGFNLTLCKRPRQLSGCDALPHFRRVSHIFRR